MNERCPELQALRLIRFYENIANWPPNSMLKKIDGIWMLVPARQASAQYEHIMDGLGDD